MFSRIYKDRLGIDVFKRSRNVGTDASGPYKREWLYDRQVGEEKTLEEFDNFPENFSNVSEILEHRAQLTPDIPGFGSRSVVRREEFLDQESGKIFEKVDLSKSYEFRSWSEVLGSARNLATGLGALYKEATGKGEDSTGEGRQLLNGQHIALYADTCDEWMVAAQASWQLSAVVVTVYTTLGVEPLTAALSQSKPSIIFVGSEEQMKTLADHADQIPSIKVVVLLDNRVNPADYSKRMPNVRIEQYKEVVKLGENLQANANLPSSMWKKQQGIDDMALIMYTSGTTGVPKGVMISHGNMIAAIRTLVALFETGREFFPDDIPKGFPYSDPSLEASYIAFLPLAHIFELTQELCMIYLGIRIGYSSTTTVITGAPRLMDGVDGDASILKPTMMAMVPAVMEKIKAGVRKKLNAKGNASKVIFHRALAWKFFFYWFGSFRSRLDSIVFKQASALVGGRLTIVACGGAPLDPGTEELVRSLLSCVICQGYALTETCAGGTVKHLFDPTLNNIGCPSLGMQVKLRPWEEGGYSPDDKPNPRGEILLSGKSVAMGYYCNKELTDECFFKDKDGRRWFATGDIGEVLPDGNLKIVDRKKDLAKVINGEYVSLNKVEACIKSAFPFVTDCICHVDPTKSRPVALLIPEYGEAMRAINVNGFPKVTCKDTCELCADPVAVGNALALVQKNLKAAGLAKFEIPCKIELINDEWTPENGMLTPTLKLKRVSIIDKYRKSIEKLHS
mmetsp:Transcript_1899/g.4327  ORF Transcript_1899/g.4327 Transcript_1899/m.4327 type:complete len:736 (-) Transcript_1899:79-2286(-)